jgi:hypothetical protein
MYPDSLEDAGLSAPLTIYGRFEYTQHENDYFIGVGTYWRHGFEVSYSPQDEWYVDH